MEKVKSSVSDLVSRKWSSGSKGRRGRLRTGSDTMTSIASAGSAESEDGWQVGGRYHAVSSRVPVRTNPRLSGGATAELAHGEPVLIISLEQSGNALAGFVVQPTSKVSGWVALEEALDRRRLEGSWEMKGRYCVQNTATLRQGKLLTSREIGQLVPGDEVLAVELGFNDGGDGCPPRLRMKVSTEKGGVGWMSPETPTGELLLYPMNLLSSKVVELSRGLGDSHEQHPLSISGVFGRKKSERAEASAQQPSKELLHHVGERFSYVPGGEMPWIAKGQYRVLSRLSMRSTSLLKSREIAKIPAGVLVTVQEVTLVECSALGRCPTALVVADEGTSQGKTGWVRCAGADGRDLVDSRNQHEFEQVLRKMTHDEAEQEAFLFSQSLEEEPKKEDAVPPVQRRVPQPPRAATCADCARGLIGGRRFRS